MGSTVSQGSSLPHLSPYVGQGAHVSVVVGLVLGESNLVADVTGVQALGPRWPAGRVCKCSVRYAHERCPRRAQRPVLLAARKGRPQAHCQGDASWPTCDCQMLARWLSHCVYVRHRPHRAQGPYTGLALLYSIIELTQCRGMKQYP